MKSFGTASPVVGAEERRLPGHGDSSVGKLVFFDKRGRRPKGRVAGTGGAQIFLFTGVRYERDGTPLPSKPAGNVKPKRKRV